MIDTVTSGNNKTINTIGGLLVTIITKYPIVEPVQ